MGQLDKILILFLRNRILILSSNSHVAGRPFYSLIFPALLIHCFFSRTRFYWIRMRHFNVLTEALVLNSLSPVCKNKDVR
jgi:hypothetical protein